MQNRAMTYQIPAASLQQSTETTVVVSPAQSSPLNLLIGGVLVLVGLALLFSDPVIKIIGLLCFSVGVPLVINHPLGLRAVIDFEHRQVAYEADYLLRPPRKVRVTAGFEQVDHVQLRQHESRPLFILDVALKDGSLIRLDFRNRGEQALQLANRLAAQFTTELPVEQEVDPAARTRAMQLAQINTALSSELNSWTIWMVVLGFIQMVSAEALAPYGVLLVLIGLASRLFLEPAMFVIYAVTMGWAMISNLIFAEMAWKGFAILQALWAYQLFQQFRKYHITTQILTGGERTRAQRYFPWISLCTGAVVLVVQAFLWFIAVPLVESLGNETLVRVVSWSWFFAFYLTLVGVATGLAGWVARFPNRWASIVGVGINALILVAELYYFFLR